MAEQPNILAEWVDPRVLRTRQTLITAMEQLLREKPVDEIAVADIAQKAAVNRATFYDHYTDKFALLEGVVDSQFHNCLVKRGIVFHGDCAAAVVGITLATCDYLSEALRMDCPDHHQAEKHFEAAIVSVIRGMILSGLKSHPADHKIRPELIAASMSGAIFAAAREWSRNPSGDSAEDVGRAILHMFKPMFPPPTRSSRSGSRRPRR